MRLRTGNQGGLGGYFLLVARRGPAAARPGSASRCDPEEPAAVDFVAAYTYSRTPRCSEQHCTKQLTIGDMVTVCDVRFYHNYGQLISTSISHT